MKKRALTLLEVMIVIFLITLITGTIGYNMKGTLDKGRAFRTEQAKAQLKDLLLICLAEKGDAEAIAKSPVRYLEELDLAKDPKNLVVDGWKKKFIISVTGKSDFDIRSEAYDKYVAKSGRNSASANEEE